MLEAGRLGWVGGRDVGGKVFVSLGGSSQRGSEDHSRFPATELQVRWGQGSEEQ